MNETMEFKDTRDIDMEQLLGLYRSVDWSAAHKPDELLAALRGAHSLLTAWDGERLIGLAYAISDGHLVVYYPHLLVDPHYQRQGVGTRLMTMLMGRYQGFHQHMLVADGEQIEFYRRLGFTRAGKTEPMWIYAGHDH